MGDDQVKTPTIEQLREMTPAELQCELARLLDALERDKPEAVGHCPSCSARVVVSSLYWFCGCGAHIVDGRIVPR